MIRAANVALPSPLLGCMDRGQEHESPLITTNPKKDWPQLPGLERVEVFRDSW